MTDKPYYRVHAENLLEHCAKEKNWNIDDQGVSPSFMEEKEAKRLGLIEEYKFFSWRPAKVFERDVNAPDVINNPATPKLKNPNAIPLIGRLPKMAHWLPIVGMVRRS